MLSVEFEELCGFDPAGKTRPELEAAVEGCGRLTSFLAAKQYSVLAELAALGDDGVTAADTNRVKTRASAQASRRAASTATQLAQMPSIQQALVAGAISPEHAEAAACAAAQVSPERADAALAGMASQLPADRFAKEARQWAGRNQDEDAARSRQERARAEREGRVWRKNNGRIGVYGEFDPVAGKPVLAAFEEEMNRLFREDGGRKADPVDDADGAEQRGADALVNLMAAPRRPAAPPVDSSCPPGRAKRPHPRYVTHLRIDVGRCTKVDPLGAAAFLDGTPLPQAVLERIACESAFVGAVYGADGAILWQGRSTRLATDDQWNALIDRDGGCRHCGADPARCQAHHLVPWAPPARGPTDIDHLVLVCDHGHHLIHEQDYQVVIDADGTYHIVPPP